MISASAFCRLFAAGSWLITFPFSISRSKFSRIVTLNPAAFRASSASLAVIPSKAGTSCSSCPLDTVITMESPRLTWDPSSILWLTTLPSGTLSSFTYSSFTISPWSPRAFLASSSVLPTTFSTPKLWPPREMVNAIAVPSSTSSPAGRSWDITWPSPTFSSFSSRTSPKTRPAFSSFSLASSRLSHTRYGTTALPATGLTTSCPLLTISFTVPFLFR